jgi:hypothetical protein
VLQFVAQGFIQVGGAEPAFNAPAAEIVAFFAARDSTLLQVGAFLSTVSVFFLLWFLGALWAELSRHEEEPAWMSLSAFGAGLVAVAILFAAPVGWTLALFRLEEGLDPQVARLLFDAGNLAFATLWVALSALLMTTSIVAFRYGALTRWLGWYGLVVAVALLVARIFWAAPSGAIFVPYVLSSIWLIAVGVVLLRRTRSAG